MNTNRNKMGGVGIYLVVIAVIAVLYFALARLSPSSSSYSYSNFLWDVQNGYVSSVLIKQNSEVPTGVLSITKTDNGVCLLCTGRRLLGRCFLLPGYEQFFPAVMV